MSCNIVEDESVLTTEDKLGASFLHFNKSNGVGKPTKIVRGGSWYAQESSGQTFSRRETHAPGSGTSKVGFRVVMENPKCGNP